MINNIRLGYPGENLTTGLRTNRTHLLNDRHPAELLPMCIKDAKKNLADLLKILEWNEENEIRFYRINSGLFPHISNWRCFDGESKKNILDFKTLFYDINLFSDQIIRVGEFAKKHGHRLTFHPLPYTVLNTPNHFTLVTVMREIWWHTLFLNIAELTEGTITLHIGGIYGNKETASKSFIDHFDALLPEMKARIIIENDEGDFSIDDLIKISSGIKKYKHNGVTRHCIPICFDYFHYCCFNINTQKDKRKYPKQSSIKKILPLIFDSWIVHCNLPPCLQCASYKEETGKKSGKKKIQLRPKMHLSEQAYHARLGTHSKFIKKIPSILCGLDIDLMLESKGKDKTLLKILKLYRQNNREVCGK